MVVICQSFRTENLKSQQNLVMSEFISFCPKCSQQILCDTAYVGCRVACPVCLQEIIMPKPQQRMAGSSQPQFQPSQPGPGSAPVPNATTAKSSPIKMIITVGAVALILVL